MSAFTNSLLSYGLQSVLLKPITRQIATYDDDIIIADVVMDENHRDTMEIVYHPVEIGSPISDHAFKLPAEVSIYMGWSLSTDPVSSLIKNKLNAYGSQFSTAANGILNNSIGLLSSATPFIGGTTGLIKAGIDANNHFYGPDTLNDVYMALLDIQANAVLFDLYTGKRRYSNMLCKSIEVDTNNATENVLLVRMACQEIIMVQTSVTQAQSSLSNPSSDGSPTNSRVYVNPIAEPSIPEFLF